MRDRNLFLTFTPGTIATMNLALVVAALLIDVGLVRRAGWPFTIFMPIAFVAVAGTSLVVLWNGAGSRWRWGFMLQLVFLGLLVYATLAR